MCVQQTPERSFHAKCFAGVEREGDKHIFKGEVIKRLFQGVKIGKLMRRLIKDDERSITGGIFLKGS